MIEVHLDAARYTILIVDDTPANLAVVVDSLEGHGYRVIVAQDGEESLRRAELVKPDLILLDVMMPGIDGFDVCRRLKLNVMTRNIPVIFMTSLADTEDVVNGFKAGGVDYVTKPLNIEEVIARVDTHLKLYAMQRQLEVQNVELQQYRKGLELQVAEHTAALSVSNRQLKEEVSERTRAEERLWESEHKYRTLIEDSPDVITRYDRDCRRTYVSAAFRVMHGRSSDEIIGKKPTEAWGSPRMSAAEFEQRIKHVLETGERAEIELDWYNPDGEYVCHWMRAVPEYDREGNIVSVLSITRDVSEARRAEKLLHLQEQEIRSLVENTPDTIARYDHNCRRIYANPRMLEDLGVTWTEVINKTPTEMPGG
jgi:PAS domain S-box-containing protein